MEVPEIVESPKLILNQWKNAQDNSFDIFLGYMSQKDGDEYWSVLDVNKVQVNTEVTLFEI